MHGLQRFRHHAPFKQSLSELDVWEALGHKVNEGVKASSKPGLATDFMNGVFTFSSNHVRRSLYPFKSKSSLKTDHSLGLAGRYRYGGAVDTLKRFGTSLDDCCLTSRASSLYQSILLEWNGFRIFHIKNNPRPPGTGGGTVAVLRRSRTVSLDRRLPLDRFAATLNHSYSLQLIDNQDVPSILDGDLVKRAPSFWYGGPGGKTGRGRPLLVQHEKQVTDKYDVNKTDVLGEGSYAHVHTAVERETGERVAVKAIRRR